MAFIPFFALNYRMPLPDFAPFRTGALSRPFATQAACMAAACAALAGCSTPPPLPVPPPAEPPPAVVIAVPVPVEVTSPPAPAARDAQDETAPPPAAVQALRQMEQILRLNPAELARETARLSEQEDASVHTPLLLAVALGQTRQPVDTARALGLAQRVLGNNAPAATPLHPLARLLESRLLQQRRLEEQLERQTQQLRDAQRRNEQLSERLEAVRAIERSLTTRPAAPAPAPAPAPANGNAPARATP